MAKKAQSPAAASADNEDEDNASALSGQQGAELQSELVSVTPLALTSDQMKVSNPAAVKVLEGDAVSANNARISAIVAQFGDDKELMAKAIADPKMTVVAIKAERYDALSSENKTLKAENETLKKQGVVGFASSDNPKAKAAADEPSALEKEAEKVWAESEKVRQEFGGVYTTFRADFLHNPEDYR